MKPTTLDAYKLLHDGAVALSRVEANGIRIDVGLLDKTIERTKKRIESQTEKLRNADEYREWRKLFGDNIQLGSRIQLGKVLNKLGHRLKEKTARGNQKLDAKVLECLDIPFVKLYLDIEKLKKLHGTYLKGLKREVVDGVLHPSFNLHTVTTYRSSSSDPNFQNIPIRDKVIGKLIRSCFVPRKGNVLVEIDFSGLEVRISACYNKDPVLIEYIETGYDMHLDMASECYMLDTNKVSKEARYCAKNMFVFPQFYGSYFAQCAPNLWDAIDKMGLNADGVSLKDHLAEQGITKLGKAKSLYNTGRNGDETGRITSEKGTFMDHIRDVGQDFWGERFKVYAQWKLDWYAKYLKRGEFNLLTGFRESGVYKRNDVINHPVQGAAFHCLLWCLNRLVKWTVKKKMKSMVVGQIHDSIIADVPRSELSDFVGTAKQLMMKDIREEWRWIIVPLDVEVEVGEKNWHEKREYEG